MDKSILRKFAIEARQELMQKMKARLQFLEIKDTKAKKEVGKYFEIQGKLYSKESYRHLIEKYQELGYEELIEESAYTWFNRLTALAYMESHDYLEEKIITPSILDRYYEASFFQNMPSEEQEKLHQLRDENTPDSLETLYSILMEEQCHALSKIMPFLFQKKGGYADILFPSGLLLENSLLFRLQKIMEEAKEVEVIGWLYQYYNSEKKDQVFEGLKKNKKITKENIPAATQLFTPHWIVKYMVENSLGKLALESIEHFENLKKDWQYYVETPLDPNAEILEVEAIRILDPAMGSGHMLTYAFDVLFDIYQELGWSKKEAVFSILENNLYGLEIDERAAQLASFALLMKAKEKFPRLLKVLEKDNDYYLNTLSLQESSRISKRIETMLGDFPNLRALLVKFQDIKEYGSILKFTDFDIEATWKEYNTLEEKIETQGQFSLLSGNEFLVGDLEEDLESFRHLIHQYSILTQKYDVVITNPPYMGTKGFSPKLKEYTEKHYKNSKSDLFAIFMEVCQEFTEKNRYTAMITMQSWMFLSSYETLRKQLMESTEMENLLHLGYGVIGIAFGTSVFCSKKRLPTGKQGNYFRMFDRIAQNISSEDCSYLLRRALVGDDFRYDFETYPHDEIEFEVFFSNPKGKLLRYQANQKDFEKIPGSPIAYWVSDRVREIFEKGENLKVSGDTRQGMATSDNNRFLRLWSEVSFGKMYSEAYNSKMALESNKKWFPYNKGGEFKKWYGNQEYLVNWDNDGEEIKQYATLLYKSPTRTIKSISEYFKPSISWSKISSGNIAFRYYPKGFIFDVAGCCIFYNNIEDKKYHLAFLNSNISKKILGILSPTLNFEAGQVALIPMFESKKNNIIINNITNSNISISKQEWDSRETSWDFERFSLLNGKTLQEGYQKYCAHWTEQFVQMHKNEEALNKIFLEIYALQEEMDETVDFKDITLLKKEAVIVEVERVESEIHTPEGYLANRGVKLEFRKEELVKQFLSYAVGCIMGRYSLDKIGLIMANSDDVLVKSSNKFTIQGKNGEARHEIENPSFYPEEFGILSVTEEKVFENDIVTRVIAFVASTYGKEKLEENLNFLADALGKKNESNEEVLRNYFIKDFYTDHLQRYQKRPIYWMLQSGKKNAFSSLIYLHRYEENTIARVRTDYLLPYQEYIEARRKYYEAISLDEHSLEKDKKVARRQCKDYDVILIELREYALEIKHIAEQKISLDLDDGVKVNYEKLGKILKKI